MFHSNLIRRAVSHLVSASALVAFGCFALWPEWAQETFRSRDALGGFSLWAAFVAFWLHPASKQVVDGLRRFHRFCKDIDRNIDLF